MTIEVAVLPEPWGNYLTRIEQSAGDFWENRIHRSYGRVQEMRVWQQVRRRLADIVSIPGIKTVTPFERFLLYTATCLYEVGWQSPTAPGLAPEQRYVKSSHLIRQSALPGGSPNFGLGGLDPMMVEALAALCAAVGQKDLHSLRSSPEPAGYYETIRLRYLAALLQLADLIVVHRGNDMYFRRLRALPPHDILDARIALQPYISLINLEGNTLMLHLRLHPDDEEHTSTIVKVLVEPFREWIGSNWEWLWREFNFRLELHEEAIERAVVIVRDGLRPEPLQRRCFALVEFLNVFVPGEYSSPHFEDRENSIVIPGQTTIPIVAKQILDSHYEVIEIIGYTAHSQVVKARDTVLARDVAIKIINPDVSAGRITLDQFKRNLLREAKLLAQLDHPYIGRVYAALTSRPGIVMQWIEGQSLQELLDSGRTFSDYEVAAIGSAVALALETAHQQDIIHRDIKPGNIILTPTEVPILIDFDISRSSLVDTITHADDGSSLYLGSPAYSAPEQFHNPSAVACPADIFALGVVLYQMLTHEFPFQWGNNSIDYPGERLPTPDQKNIPDMLYTLLCKMLSSSPADRPSAQMVHEVLNEFKPYEPNDRPVDFVIGAALEEELDAVLAKLPGFRRLDPSPEDIRIYYAAQIPVTFPSGAKGIYEVRMLLLGKGQKEATLAASDAIRRWKPSYMLIVGIAGGVKAKGVSLGDVLVADQIIDYELQKQTAKRIEMRWDVHQVNKNLVLFARSIRDYGWLQLVSKPRPCAPLGKSKCYIGPIASGNKVIAYGKVIDRYRDVWSLLIGVEMEAAGVAAAAFQQAQPTRFFMVRGVSDLADEAIDSQDVKDWRAYACDVAAAYTVALLQRGPISIPS